MDHVSAPYSSVERTKASYNLIFVCTVQTEAIIPPYICQSPEHTISFSQSSSDILVKKR